MIESIEPTLGTVGRSSNAVSSVFIEPASTAARGQASFGITFQDASFDGLDDYDMRDSDLVTVSNRFVDESAPSTSGH